MEFFMRNSFELSVERLSQEKRSNSAELLIAMMLSYEIYDVVFEKRGRFIFPVSGDLKLPPMPAFAGGAFFNHFRELCRIRYPTQSGHFTCTVDGNAADFGFHILNTNNCAFAELAILENTIDFRLCKNILREYFERRRAETSFLERVFESIHVWWSGKNLHKLYEIR